MSNLNINSAHAKICYAIADTLRKGDAYTTPEIIERVQHMITSKILVGSIHTAIYKLTERRVFSRSEVTNEYGTIYAYTMNYGRQELRDSLNYKYAATLKPAKVVTAPVQAVAEIQDELVSQLSAKVKELENKLNVIAAAICASGRNIEALFS